MCGFRELRGVISKVPKENDSDLRWWRREGGKWGGGRRSIHTKGSDGHFHHVHLGDNGAWSLYTSLKPDSKWGHPENSDSAWLKLGPNS